MRSLIFFVFAALFCICGCGGGGGGLTSGGGGSGGGVTVNNGTTNVTVVSLEVSGISTVNGSFSVPKGISDQVTLTAVFSNGTHADVTNVVNFTSSNSSILRVTANGLVTGEAVGVANITVSYQGLSTSVAVIVSPAQLVSLQLTPSNASLARGLSQQFIATGTFDDQSFGNLTNQVNWSSSNTSLVTIDSSGLASAGNVGRVTIAANLNGISASTSLTVTSAQLKSIQVTPNSPSLARGLNEQLGAIGTFSDSTSSNISSQVTWSSSDSTLVNISSSGAASAANVGAVNITASLNGVSGGTLFTVTSAQLQTIQVTPTNPSVARGFTQQFAATGVFSDNSLSNLTTQVTWSSGNGNLAPVSNAAGQNGLATAANVGTANITASLSGLSGSTQFTITPAQLESLQITPTNPSLAKGYSEQFTATGMFSDSSVSNLSNQVTWSSSNTNLVPISNLPGQSGLATAANIGVVNITANLNGVTSSTVFNVTAAQLLSLQLVGPSTLPRGLTGQFGATGTFSDQTVANLTSQVVWASNNTNVAAISNQGLVSAANLGSVNITATLGPITGSTPLTVTAAQLTGISVTSASANIPSGLTLQLYATGSYSDSSSANLTTQVTWSSNNTAIASVSNAAGSQGLATGLSVGSANLTATFSGVAGAAPINVTSALLTHIQVYPANARIHSSQTQQFTANGTYSDGSVSDITNAVTWTSSSPAVAGIVANSGLAAGATITIVIPASNTTVGASLAGLSSSANLTVTPPTGTIQQFSDGISARAELMAICAGPDGNVWFTEAATHKVGQITPLGVITEFPSNGYLTYGPESITAGPDGNLWAVEPLTTLARITPTGLLTEFSGDFTNQANSICAGLDGNLWVTESDRIAQVTVTNGVAEFSSGLTANSYPSSICAGGDGNVWFTESGTSGIGRITPSGTITEFINGISHQNSQVGAGLGNIAAGPDGNLWFPESYTNKIGQITVNGSVAEFPVAGPANSYPIYVCAGPDGNLWFILTAGSIFSPDMIGRITPLGSITFFPSGSSRAADLIAIVTGPDGNLWFTEQGTNRIGVIVP